MRFLLIKKHSLSTIPFTKSCLNLLWNALIINRSFFDLFWLIFIYPILWRFLVKLFSSFFEESLIFLNFFIFFKSKLCHQANLFWASSRQGNFSPGSFLRSGDISEWPRIFLWFILYFLIRYFKSFFHFRIHWF